MATPQNLPNDFDIQTSEPKTSVSQYPVTVQRTPYVSSAGDKGFSNIGKATIIPYLFLWFLGYMGNSPCDIGVARASIASSSDHPNGTVEGNWNKQHKDRTVLQQHCDFFDPDHDGVIWPLDTFRGFRNLGFNLFLSLLAVFVIHANLSYPTVHGILPDPFFRVYLDNIHKDKHGSDTGAYDNEGRFIPQKFEDFFAKYGSQKDGLTALDIWKGIKGQRVVMDPIGWGAAVFECV